MDICKEELVSCVISTRNRQFLLEKALRSVISQTYKNLEILVVDDASEDNTELLVKKYIKIDRRIKYFKNGNRSGGSNARNVGINEARGDYIAFLDDDDEWMTNKTEIQLQHIQPFDAILCSSFLGNKRRIRHPNKHIVFLKDLRKGNIFGGTSTLMAKSSVMKNHPFDEDLFNGQDWDIFVRIASAYTLGYVDECLVIQNDGCHERISNEVVNMPINHLERRLNAIYKHKAFLGPHWVSYYVAKHLLSYIWYRENKFDHIIYTIRRCGWLSVMEVVIDRIVLDIKSIFAKSDVPPYK